MWLLQLLSFFSFFFAGIILWNDIYSHQVLQRSTGLFLDRQCAYWHQIIGWKNTGIFQASNTGVCHLLIWISSLTIVIPICGGFSKKKSIQIRLWTQNPGSLGFISDLVTDAVKMGKSLPSLSEFRHLANVDSDTHHQTMFAKCLMVRAVRWYIIASSWIIFSNPKNSSLF